jgi:repressor LexA
MNIGERVKQLRQQKGMTQEELASRLGYKSKSSVAHIENGRDIPRSMVVKLADILNTTPAYLMGWEQQESAPIKHDRNAVIERINSLPDDQFEKFATKAEGYLDGLEDQ